MCLKIHMHEHSMNPVYYEQIYDILFIYLFYIIFLHTREIIV